MLITSVFDQHGTPFVDMQEASRGSTKMGRATATITKKTFIFGRGVSLDVDSCSLGPNIYMQYLWQKNAYEYQKGSVARMIWSVMLLYEKSLWLS